MASLDKRGNVYRICFRLPNGTQIKRSLQTDKEKEAKGKLAILERTLADVELGLKIIPEDADPVAFLISGGAVKKVEIEAAESFGRLVEQYQQEVTKKEANTLYTEKMHLNHLKRLIGPRTSSAR